MTGHNRHKRRNLEADAARADGIADRAARDDRHVMLVLCKSLGWDVETDGEGSYVIYPGIANPEWDRGYCV
jgi:translation initiation factor 2 beta subunit (eIF-2beta)/eIF-5